MTLLKVFGGILQKASPQHTTLGDLVCSALRRAILGGVLGPGERLQQDVLAEALGVSRVPVRSALLQLQAEGLIELQRHRGATVARLSPSEIRDIYEARIVLETHALRKAVEAMTPDRLARLEELASRLDAEHSGEGFLEARSEFYRTLYGAGGNEVIVDIIERLRGNVGRYWLRQRVVHGSEPPHGVLLDCIRRRKPEEACRWLERHLRQVAELRALPARSEAESDGPPAIAASLYEVGNHQSKRGATA